MLLCIVMSLKDQIVVLKYFDQGPWGRSTTVHTLGNSAFKHISNRFLLFHM